MSTEIVKAEEMMVNCCSYLVEAAVCSVPVPYSKPLSLPCVCVCSFMREKGGGRLGKTEW